MRRSLTTVIALSMICQAAFAAGQQEEAGAESRTLRIASWGVQEAATAPYFELLKEQFEEANPGVTVEYIGYPYGQIKQQVLVMAAAGEAPDIVQSARSWFPGFVSSGYFTPLDDYVTSPWLEDMFPAIRADLTIDGELWAAPWFYSPFVMFYNTDLFRQAGLDPENPPTTYSEALEA
ncbi:MAG: extracellular solute-binding protein, partial [Spirochaetales bacterium]|nr:extracellular solute-binding protein [Spirochaetales bacterium]